MPPHLLTGVVGICVLLSTVSGNPKPEIAQKSSKLTRRQLSEYGAPDIDTYGPPATTPCKLDGPLPAPTPGADCRPGDQSCKDECTTIQEEVCQQTYQQQCKTVTDQKCSTIYEDKCDTKYESVCRKEYDTKCEQVYEDKCSVQYEDVPEKVCDTVYDPVCKTVTDEKCEIRYEVCFTRLIHAS
jgi:hypothetical protein